MSDAPPLDSPFVVFYDGECGLCDRIVQLLLRIDRRGVLRYAPLQGETARALVGGPGSLDTMVFLDRSAPSAPRVSRRARAAFEILHRLGGGWLALSWMRVLPAWLIDPFYGLVARNRFAIFGRLDQCRIPDPTVSARFLP